MKRLRVAYTCDICGLKRSIGYRKIDHSKCSKIRQKKFQQA